MKEKESRKLITLHLGIKSIEREERRSIKLPLTTRWMTQKFQECSTPRLNRRYGPPSTRN